MRDSHMNRRPFGPGSLTACLSARTGASHVPPAAIWTKQHGRDAGIPFRQDSSLTFVVSQSSVFVEKVTSME